MTIIVFLIDTSASMNQRVYSFGRPTLLDVAKGSVETFVKIRQRSPDSKGDRYMLLTFDEHPRNIRAGWKENLQTFTQELKNLQAFGMTNLGVAVKNTFDVLNVNRMQSGIDTYGQGRCPFFLEPSVVVCITDSGKLTGTSVSVTDELKIPRDSRVPGSELTREAYRWDQRFFSLVLRMAGTPTSLERSTDPAAVTASLVDTDCNGIDKLCEITGGRSYSVTSQRALLQCVESLVQKIQSGVVINFEKIGPDPPAVPVDTCQSSDDGTLELRDSAMTSIAPGVEARSRPESPSLSGVTGTPSWHCCRRLIFVPRSAQKGFPPGHWPIPESFWPEITAPSLVARSAHPCVRFSCVAREPMVVDNLPFDKYELEASQLTQFILSRKQPAVCWQVFVMNSSKNGGMGHAFGYLKASTNLSCVNLFVLPYNYPVLLPLLDELFKVHRLKPTKDWKVRFDNYIRTVPAYYSQPLRQAMKRMGAPNLVPENMDNGMSVNVVNNLKRLKNQARLEYERMCADVAARQQSPPATSAALPTLPASIDLTSCIRVTVPPARRSSLSVAGASAAVLPGLQEARQRTSQTVTSNPSLSHQFSELTRQLSEVPSLSLVVRERRLATHRFRNAFDISRAQLLDQLSSMRTNLLQAKRQHIQLHDQDQLHSMPVGNMGNYQEYLKRMTPPLKELETTPVRQHMFGNPFKIDKRMMVDEADVDLLDKSPRAAGTMSTGAAGRNSRLIKRRPGSPFAAVGSSPVQTSPLSSAFSTPSSDSPRRQGLGVSPDLPVSNEKVTNNVSSQMEASNDNPRYEYFSIADVGGATAMADLNNQSFKVENDSCVSPGEDPSIVSLTELEDDAELGDINVHSSSGANPALTDTPLHHSSPNLPDESIGDLTSSLVNHFPAFATVDPVCNGVLHSETAVTPYPVDSKSDRQLRLRLFQLVRRPGREYSALLSMLHQFMGDEFSKRRLLNDLISEAVRLRRRHLVTVLEQLFSLRGRDATSGILVSSHNGFMRNCLSRLPCVTPLIHNNGACIDESC